MEVNNLEVEEELSTMATLAWAGNLDGKRGQRAERSLDEPGLRGSDVEASERTCRSCHERDPATLASCGHSGISWCLKGQKRWT